MAWGYSYMPIEVLVGKVITQIEQNGKEELLFRMDNGDIYKMYHEQDCCEYVYIEDICGDLQDLILSPITMAECVTDNQWGEWGSTTWTFYKLATLKGYVTLRWCGESNGCYSEEVDFVKVN